MFRRLRGFFGHPHTSLWRRSCRAIEWLDFFLADVQTGLGPFLTAYLASAAWSASSVGFVLSFGGLVSVALQTPAGGIVDASRKKKLLLSVAIGALVSGAILLAGHAMHLKIYAAQALIGGAEPFLLPTVAVITLGIVGPTKFDAQFGRNRAFNSAGNVFTSLLVAYVSYRLGYRAIFVVAALLALPALASLAMVDGSQINNGAARGAAQKDCGEKADRLSILLRDRVLLVFLFAAFHFHWATPPCFRNLGKCLLEAVPNPPRPSCLRALSRRNSLSRSRLHGSGGAVLMAESRYS